MQWANPKGLHQHLNGIFAVAGQYNQWKSLEAAIANVVP